MGNRSNMVEEGKRAKQEERGTNNMEKEEGKGINHMGKETNHMERATKHTDKAERVRSRQEPYSTAYAITADWKAILGKGART